jgi:glutathione S-transferase
MSDASAAAAKDRIQLFYWNGRGLGEVPRQLLAIAGKFPPADYDDRRVDNPADAGDLSANLGRMPVLRVGDVNIGQSAAINLYVAQVTGAMGKTPAEAAKIQNIAEHVAEMVRAYRVLCPYGSEPKAEDLDKWFSGGATDTTGVADGSGAGKRYLKWFVGRIENDLQDNGFAVGNSISLADVLLYNTFAEVLKPEESAKDVADYQRHAFTSLDRTMAVVKDAPRLSKILDTVKSNANLQKWLAQRGIQGF